MKKLILTLVFFLLSIQLSYAEKFKVYLHENKLMINSGNNIIYQEELEVLKDYTGSMNKFRLTHTYDKPYLIITLDDFNVTAIVFGFFDTTTKKWVFRFDNEDNPNVMTYSPDNKYVVIDSGTSGGSRGLDIFNLENGKHELASGYQTFTFPYWNENRLYYYRYAGKTAPGHPPLTNRQDNKIYIQKVYFENGVEIKTQEYTNWFEEG